METNKIFNYSPEESIGQVCSVDSINVIIKAKNNEALKGLQINQLLVVNAPRAALHLIGIITKITRKASADPIAGEDSDDLTFLNPINTDNFIKIALIGEIYDKKGTKYNVFKRNISALPEIDSDCFTISGATLTNLMQTIASTSKSQNHPLVLGCYSIDPDAIAYIDGDKLFQRHAIIVGSTGSGKSYCVAKLVEQIAELNMSNAIVFDIHGEYSTESFKRAGIEQYRIASPADLLVQNKLKNKILMLPYWLLSYEEMQAMLLDRSDTNAPNQAMLLSKTVLEAKQNTVKGTPSLQSILTVDSPIPYDLNQVLFNLKQLDTAMIPGVKAGSEKQGPYFGKLTRFNQRLEAKLADKRLGFLFHLSSPELKTDWMLHFCNTLMGAKQNNNGCGVKIIDFSEVPSDILPLILGLITRIIFSVQQWSDINHRHPIALLCDEAHLYIPERKDGDIISTLSLNNFERVAKEGRKYGVSLVVISQRPAEVNHTVLSQCNNFIALRLTNGEDQNIIKKLLPDNLGNIAENLSILDVGEAIVVGDASLLPSRIIIEEPQIKPSSQTVPFWQKWSDTTTSQDIANAVHNMIRQSKS